MVDALMKARGIMTAMASMIALAMMQLVMHRFEAHWKHEFRVNSVFPWQKSVICIILYTWMTCGHMVGCVQDLHGSKYIIKKKRAFVAGKDSRGRPCVVNYGDSPPWPWQRQSVHTSAFMYSNPLNHVNAIGPVNLPKHGFFTIDLLYSDLGPLSDEP